VVLTTLKTRYASRWKARTTVAGQDQREDALHHAVLPWENGYYQCASCAGVTARLPPSTAARTCATSARILHLARLSQQLAARLQVGSPLLATLLQSRPTLLFLPAGKPLAGLAGLASSLRNAVLPAAVNSAAISPMRVSSVPSASSQKEANGVCTLRSSISRSFVAAGKSPECRGRAGTRAPCRTEPQLEPDLADPAQDRQLSRRNPHRAVVLPPARVGRGLGYLPSPSPSY